MRFFRTYLARKAFAGWVRAVRLQCYRRTRERLAQNLFLANPTFASSLVDVVGTELAALTNVEVQDFKSPKAFEMATFSEKQNIACQGAAQTFEGAMTRIVKCLVDVSRACKARRSHYAQLRERDDDFDTRERNRHKSIVVMKDELAERTRAERRAQKDFASLGDLVRLVDYRSVDCLLTVALTEQARLEDELAAPRIKQGLWETTVKFAIAPEGKQETTKKTNRTTKKKKQINGEEQSLTGAKTEGGGQDGVAKTEAGMDGAETEEDGEDEDEDEDEDDSPLGMRFEPDLGDTLTMVRRKNEGMIEMMDQVTRVCHVRRLRTHLRQHSTQSSLSGNAAGSARGGGGSARPHPVLAPGQQQVSVSSLIRQSPSYIQSCSAIDSRVRDDFARAAEYALQFEAVREIYDFRISEYEIGLREERRRHKEQQLLENAGNGGDSGVDGDGMVVEDLEGGGDGDGDGDGDAASDASGPSPEDAAAATGAPVGFAVEAAHIRKHMDTCEAWSKSIERMRAHGTIGVLYVESRKLKNALLPITEKFLEHLERELNVLARERCKIALDEYKRRVNALEDRPVRLGEFADFVATTQRVESERRVAFRETGVIDEMYRTLHAHRVRVQPDDMVQLDDLKAAQGTFVEASAAAEDFVFGRMSEMTQNLDMSIAHLNEQVSAIKEELTGGARGEQQRKEAAKRAAAIAAAKEAEAAEKTEGRGDDGDDAAAASAANAAAAAAAAAVASADDTPSSIFDDPSGDPTQVLSVLATLTSRLDALTRRSEDFSRYQRLFGKTVYTYRALRETSRLRDQRAQLWESLDTLARHSQDWLTGCEFRELDAEVRRP